MCVRKSTLGYRGYRTVSCSYAHTWNGTHQHFHNLAGIALAQSPNPLSKSWLIPNLFCTEGRFFMHQFHFVIQMFNPFKWAGSDCISIYGSNFSEPSFQSSREAIPLPLGQRHLFSPRDCEVAAGAIIQHFYHQSIFFFRHELGREPKNVFKLSLKDSKWTVLIFGLLFSTTNSKHLFLFWICCLFFNLIPNHQPAMFAKYPLIWGG